MICMVIWPVLYSAAQSLENEKITWYDFYWDGDESNPKDAMLLKSVIDTVNFNFRWQFDTGSPRTFFYGNLWNSFTVAFPYLDSLFFTIDTLKSDGFVNLRNNAVRISGNKLPGNIIGLLPGYGGKVSKDIILQNPGASVPIGTMGIDIFRLGVLLIDFKNNKIGYSDRLTRSFYKEKHNIIDFMLYQNRIIIPVGINEEVFYVFYDSGASLFPLKTTSAFTGKLPGITFTDTLRNITTWGKSYDVPGGRFNGTLKIGNLTVNDAKVYVHPDPDEYHTKIFSEAGTYGLIGNAYFDNKIVVIDFTTLKFTIIE